MTRQLNMKKLYFFIIFLCSLSVVNAQPTNLPIAGTSTVTVNTNKQIAPLSAIFAISNLVQTLFGSKFGGGGIVSSNGQTVLAGTNVILFATPSNVTVSASVSHAEVQAAVHDTNLARATPIAVFAGPIPLIKPMYGTGIGIMDAVMYSTRSNVMMYVDETDPANPVLTLAVGAVDPSGNHVVFDNTFANGSTSGILSTGDWNNFNDRLAPNGDGSALTGVNAAALGGLNADAYQLRTDDTSYPILTLSGDSFAFLDSTQLRILGSGVSADDGIWKPQSTLSFTNSVNGRYMTNRFGVWWLNVNIASIAATTGYLQCYALSDYNVSNALPIGKWQVSNFSTPAPLSAFVNTNYTSHTEFTVWTNTSGLDMALRLRSADFFSYSNMLDGNMTNLPGVGPQKNVPIYAINALKPINGGNQPKYFTMQDSTGNFTGINLPIFGTFLGTNWLMTDWASFTNGTLALNLNASSFTGLPSSSVPVGATNSMTRFTTNVITSAAGANHITVTTLTNVVSGIALTITDASQTNAVLNRLAAGIGSDFSGAFDVAGAATAATNVPAITRLSSNVVTLAVAGKGISVTASNQVNGTGVADILTVLDQTNAVLNRLANGNGADFLSTFVPIGWYTDWLRLTNGTVAMPLNAFLFSNVQASNLVGGQIPLGTLFDYTTDEPNAYLLSSSSGSRHRNYDAMALTNGNPNTFFPTPVSLQATIAASQYSSNNWLNVVDFGAVMTPHGATPLATNDEACIAAMHQAELTHRPILIPVGDLVLTNTFGGAQGFTNRGITIWGLGAGAATFNTEGSCVRIMTPSADCFRYNEQVDPAGAIQGDEGQIHHLHIKGTGSTSTGSGIVFTSTNSTTDGGMLDDVAVESFGKLIWGRNGVSAARWSITLNGDCQIGICITNEPDRHSGTGINQGGIITVEGPYTTTAAAYTAFDLSGMTGWEIHSPHAGGGTNFQHWLVIHNSVQDNTFYPGHEEFRNGSSSVIVVDGSAGGNQNNSIIGGSFEGSGGSAFMTFTEAGSPSKDSFFLYGVHATMDTNIQGQAAQIILNHDGTQYITSFGLPMRAAMFAGSTFITNCIIDDYVCQNQIPNANTVDVGLKVKVVSTVPNTYWINEVTNMVTLGRDWVQQNGYYLDKVNGLIPSTTSYNFWNAPQTFNGTELHQNTVTNTGSVRFNVNNSHNVFIDNDQTRGLVFMDSAGGGGNVTDFAVRGPSYGQDEFTIAASNARGGDPTDNTTARIFMSYNFFNDRFVIGKGGSGAGLNSSTANFTVLGTAVFSNTVAIPLGIVSGNITSSASYFLSTNTVVNVGQTNIWPNLVTLSSGLAQMYRIDCDLTVTNFISSGLITNTIFFRDENGANSAIVFNQNVTALNQYVSSTVFCATNASPFSNSITVGSGNFGGRFRISISGLGGN